MEFTARQKISESATTSVYRAHDDALGREVLLKVLHRHLAHDKQLRQRFIREARACAAIRSDNVVQIYDLREHEGAPAIVMEYVDGRSLKELIAEGTHCNQAFAEKVAVQVLRGLAAANARGIIHRDIKPGNILVSTAGTIKITDFGLAQIAAAPTLTAEGMVVGTPAYMAPEVLRGEVADARTDLFSLGAALAETVTGRRLFEGDSYSDCVTRISLFKPEMLDALEGAASPAFIGFLKKLMDPDRSRRYGSPEAALAALRQTGSSEFVVPEPGRPRTARRAWLRAGAGFILLAAAAGLYAVVQHFVSAPDPRGSLPVEPASSPVTTVQPADSPGTKPVSQVVERSPAPVRQSPASVPESARRSQDSASVVLLSSPGVKVHVDSLFAGEMPLAGPLRLSAGPHTIVFTHRTLDPLVRVVRLAPGERLTVRADFLEQAGYLRCTSSPWAEISVDDQYRETTPFDQPIAVTAGKHRLRFHHPAFRDSIWDVSIAPQETVFVSVNFR